LRNFSTQPETCAGEKDQEAGTFSASQMMTVEALGKYLDVSKSVLYRLVKSGRLPAVKVGRQWRMNLEKVQDYLIDLYEAKTCTNKKGKRLHSK
jgi:excisionase family DNA binding protein